MHSERCDRQLYGCTGVAMTGLSEKYLSSSAMTMFHSSLVRWGSINGALGRELCGRHLFDYPILNI